MTLLLGAVIAILVLLETGIVPVSLATVYVLSRSAIVRRFCYGAAALLAVGSPLLLVHLESLPPDSGRAFESSAARVGLLAIAVAPILRSIKLSGWPRRKKILASSMALFGPAALVAIHARYVQIDPQERAPRDPMKAAAYHRRRCDRGDASQDDGWNCLQLGRQYQAGEGVPRDQSKAVALYERACELRDRHGCLALGNAYQKGDGAAKDLERARAFYERDCRGFFGAACYALGSLYLEGLAGPMDPRTAAELFDKACNQGYPLGCTTLGSLYANGEGVEEDPMKAVELFKRSCFYGRGKDGQAEGCYNLGVMYEEGRGVGKHLAQAAVHYKSACEGGLELGCQAFRRVSP